MVQVGVYPMARALEVLALRRAERVRRRDGEVDADELVGVEGVGGPDDVGGEAEEVGVGYVHKVVGRWLGEGCLLARHALYADGRRLCHGVDEGCANVVLGIGLKNKQSFDAASRCKCLNLNVRA